MPTAFTVIGAVLGTGTSFNPGILWSNVNNVLFYWSIIPFLAITIAFSLSKILTFIIPSDYHKNKINYLNFGIGLFVAYTAGANSVGLAIGPLYSLGYNLNYLLLLGGFSILLGAWLLSPRIIHTVSFEYSNIGPRRSISALGTPAILAQIGIHFGIPISFSEAIIFSMIGSGLVLGKSNIGKKKLAYTIGAWIFAFALSISISFLLSEITRGIL
ncbi:MAG: Phosphate/sulfate permease PitA [Candidatus Methanohalarchaeum thermophilum]|uniref:Phosphate/sulfate permease PitA n=1 Tax=Methanohalarchaeum thermophilum TaxID=1903181 RepID=A0A1Q6DWL6_METT1|nr:MAG: Phosphate/sulfate permease PitA [Candidatus Methanohalarchaeum thermophilum]